VLYKSLKNKALTETDEPSCKPEKQNLTLSLFSGLELDPDLKLIVQRW
jgi:hypothetical protein